MAAQQFELGPNTSGHTRTGFPDPSQDWSWDRSQDPDPVLGPNRRLAVPGLVRTKPLSWDWSPRTGPRTSPGLVPGTGPVPGPVLADYK